MNWVVDARCSIVDVQLGCRCQGSKEEEKQGLRKKKSELVNDIW